MSEKMTRVLLVEDEPDAAKRMDGFLAQHKPEMLARLNIYPELKSTDIGYYARPLLEANPECSVVGEYETGEDALLACSELLPDVVLLCQPNDMSQFEFVERLRESYPEIGVVVARYNWGDEMRDMLLLGAMYLPSRPFLTPNLYELLQGAKENPPSLVLSNLREKGIH